jgi:hypothetical protein
MSHSYYVVSKGSGLIVTDGPNITRAYRSFGAAMATRTRLCRKSGWNISELSIIATSHYKPKMITRTNLMTGQTFEEDVNTPNCCSPASETFWSM